MDSFNNNPRILTWPDEVGYWWFYGYRYGKISCGTECEKEIVLCNCRQGGNSLMVTGDGQMFFESELEEPAFCPATLPELPNE
mgnify:CR=1 FL=1